MNKITLRQVLIPLITIAIILFLWFGPIRISYIENILISILIIIANYIEYKGKPFAALGFQREKFTFKNIFLFAPLLALGLFAFYVFLLVPGITMLTDAPIDYSAFDELKGNLPACLIALVVVWATAGFGEEIIFRGYFMRQFVKFFGESKVSIVLNIVLLACFFGFMHSYQGITGQLVTGIVGALLALIFYLRKYDLWFVIAVHGFFDTIALICVYFGLT
ncbi:CPBP family intramembrane glutamic endopeptidase [Winogradskyella immobilis]|uniref:CPBP family intramembrane metalloprotease n=1 Tax=Winogradskyella immobilis TaxID=2816852 RepID=A0ABS8EJK1_9FLAO|nr:CPBP family intramembrane glutamic endopeptidase [Winogradskyella immobilis]MCC1483369.1 CPBP family intramembrane metalloprotease [Winogradskyella immobilis]MCG0015463.1 CPBP family intramembrane metalloprotease [Winogradskyella immobilis]